MSNSMAFDGDDFVTARDGQRLRTQLDAIRAFMGNSEWHRLEWIALQTGAGEASVSAQLRNLRKQRFGGYIVERRRIDGCYAYRVLPPPAAVQMELL